jgi:hypothetical protein
LFEPLGKRNAWPIDEIAGMTSVDEKIATGRRDGMSGRSMTEIVTANGARRRVTQAAAKLEESVEGIGATRSGSVRKKSISIRPKADGQEGATTADQAIAHGTSIKDRLITANSSGIDPIRPQVPTSVTEGTPRI